MLKSPAIFLNSLALATSAFLVGAPACAQSVEDFYRGKTITMIIGTGENAGAVETYPRALAQVMKKYLPGSPNIIVSNMPGAGGNVLANHLDRIAPKDGTFMGITFPSIIIDPLLAENHRGYDPTNSTTSATPIRKCSSACCARTRRRKLSPISSTRK